MNKNFGKTVIIEPLDKAIKYLLIFMFIIGSITMIKTIYEFKVVLNIIKNEVPEFILENGHLYCEKDMLRVKEDNSSIFVINATGKYNEQVLDLYDNGIFISSTKIIEKQNLRYKTYNLFWFDWLNFTKSHMLKFIDKGLIPFSIVIYIVGLLGIFFVKFINVVIIGILSLIINLLMKTKLGFKNVIKLSIYAISLPTIIKLVTILFKINIPFFFIIYYGLTMYYIYRYLSEYKKDLGTINPIQDIE